MKCLRAKKKALLDESQIPRDSVLRHIGPHINPDCGLIMKLDGRLEHAELPACTRKLIIMALDHPLTKLIIEDCHQIVWHSGVEHILSILRKQYYLPRGRRAILRNQRRAFLRVFTNVGLDFFGPFQVVVGRRSFKIYGILLTSLSSLMVHLEVLDSMDDNSFIMVFRRFISLRGSPAFVYSDNGTNIKAGGKELAEGIKNLNYIRVSGEMVDRGIEYRYSLPTGSH